MTDDAQYRQPGSTPNDEDQTVLYDEASAPIEQLPATGQTWGKYLIEDHLASGGQAVVLQAFDRLGAHGHVALKIPRQCITPQVAERWLQTEVKALARLDHPNVARVLDANIVDGVPYVATERVKGLALQEYTARHDLSAEEIRVLATQMTEAIQAAHAAGLIHRDLKPHNVIIEPPGASTTPVARVIDFGIASLVDGYAQTVPIELSSGTPPFMAPEQAREASPVDHRVDIFALGGLIKWMLDGQGPYGHCEDREAYITAARTGQVQFVNDTAGDRLRRRLAAIAHRAMQPDPDDRYANVGQMLDDLRKLAPAKRRWLLPLAAASILAAVTAAVLVGNGMGSTQPPVAPPATTPDQAVALDADLQVHFQRADREGVYQTLNADALPLCTGDRIQIHGRLSRPAYPCLAAIGPDGKATILYPAADATQQAVAAVAIPPGRNQWLRLQDPAGTESILLLASSQPIDRQAVERQLAGLRTAPPRLGFDGMLVLDKQGVRKHGGGTKSIGDETVTAEKGFLADLTETVGPHWDVIRAICFAHVHEMPSAQ